MYCENGIFVAKTRLVNYQLNTDNWYFVFNDFYVLDQRI